MAIQDPFKLLYGSSMAGNQSTPAPNMSTSSGPVYAPPTTATKTVQRGVPNNTAAQNQTNRATPPPITPPPSTPSPTDRPTVTLSGSKVAVTKNGQTKMIDSSLVPSFERAGYVAERSTSAPGANMTPPPATTETAPPPAMEKNIFDLYGMEGNQKPATDNVFSLYGVEQPQRGQADTSQYDDMIDQFRPTGDKEKIQEMLTMQLSDISNRYGLQREEAKRQTESEFQSQLSGLYSAGVVNPLSSGTGSIDAASDAILDRRMKAIQAQETAEKAVAIARAYEQETAASDRALQFATQQRARIEDQVNETYEYDRQQVSDKINMVNSVVNAWKSGQTMNRQQKLDAQAGVMDLISTFGSSAFDGMDQDKIGEVEKATGYPEGSLFKGIAALKEKELVKPEEKMNLYKMKDGLYNISRDENGAIKTELIIPEMVKGGGSGGGSSSKETGKSFEEWLAEKEEQDFMTYNIGDKVVLDDLMAEYQTTVASKQKDTREYKYETRKIGSTTYQLKKDKKTGEILERTPLLETGSTGEVDTTMGATSQASSKYSF